MAVTVRIWLTELIPLPLIASIWSPGSKPALSPGLLICTLLTTAPEELETICIPSQLAVGQADTAGLITGVLWIAAPPLGPVPVCVDATVDVPVWWGFFDPPPSVAASTTATTSTSARITPAYLTMGVRSPGSASSGSAAGSGSGSGSGSTS